MKFYQVKDLKITLDKEGAREFSKVSYPLRYGRFAEIKSPEHVFHFNLNGEIKFIAGLGRDWPDPSEWLKRTVTNDWIYYSTGGYSGVFDSFGEYYLPCPSYPTNSINMNDPFNVASVKKALVSWEDLHKRIIKSYTHSLPDELKDFLEYIINKSPENLDSKSRELHEIIGDRITVLPPDTRHVDYDVIPIIIADGCLYRCDFCRVKSKKIFSMRSRENIKTQIKKLKGFYGHDVSNYNAIFLGQHDALNSNPEIIENAAITAYREFGLDHSNIMGPSLFLFGSVDSLLNAEDELFGMLENLPYSTYINIGIESCHQETLKIIGKGITTESVEKAFEKILKVNRNYNKIEITSNFIFGENLPKEHIPSFFHLMDKMMKHYYPKGAIYFSPVINGNRDEKRGIKREFYKIKTESRLPVYLYLIQRL